MVLSAGTKLYSMSTVGVATDRSNALSFTVGARWSFHELGGFLFGTNGLEAVDLSVLASGFATTAASVGTLPVGRYSAVAGNRVWMASPFTYAGLTATQAVSALFFSEIGDGKNWPAANVVLFKPGDGEEITGIAPVGDGLLVFKRTAVWYVYDLDTGANRQISDNIGSVSHRCLASDGNRVYFLTTDRGPYLCDGANVVPVKNAELLRPRWEDLNQATAYNANGIIWRGRYLFSFPRASQAGALSSMYEYDPYSGAWWEYSTPSGYYQMVSFEPVSDPAPILYGGAVATSGFGVKQLDVTGVLTDHDSGAFTRYYQTRHENFGPRTRKRVKRVTAEGKNAVFAKLYADDEDGASVELALGAGQVATGSFPPGPPAVGRSFALEFSGHPDEATEVHRAWLEMLPRND
jgi:hypothetical protein